jgi:hypothetical protein
MRKIVLDADFEISRNPAAGRSLIAGVFMETDEDGLTTVKNSGSTFENIDISNNANASYIHDLIFDGTVSIKILANGGEAITLQSDILTASHLTIVEGLITGNMDSVNGYDIDEYQLIYKLIVWEYITPTYIKTIKPYVVYNDVNNSNDATTALSYEMPITKVTANKGAMAITSNPLAIVWSDGAVRDCGGVDAERTGAGVGFVYLIGNYSRLTAAEQIISSIENICNDITILELQNNQISSIDITNKLSLQRLNLSYNALLNVSDVSDFAALTDLRLDFTNSTITTVSNNVNLTQLNLNNTNSTITSVSNNTLLTYLNLSYTNSTITSVVENTLLAYLNLANTNSTITTVSNNTLLAYLNLANTNSTITTVSNNTLLTHLFLINTNSTITTVSNNPLLINLNLHDTNSTITSVSNNTLLAHLYLSDTNSTITTVSNNTLLINLGLANTNSTITEVRNLCRYIRVDNTDNTAANNNTLMQNLIDNPRNGIKELTFTANSNIDQSNVTILVAAGWDITQL